jgi:predicted ATPase
VDRSYLHDTPLVGRKAEWMTLTRQLQRLRTEAGSNVVIIEGEAGIGKSRLIAELSRSATADGLRVLIAVADAVENSTPYYGWRSVFKNLFGLAAAMDSAEVRERVFGAFPTVAELETMLPLLSGILPFSLPDNDRTVEMAGPTRAENTRRLLRAILQAATLRSPTVLVLEDAHWLDPASWALLQEVIRSVKPLLTVIVVRPGTDQLAPGYAQLLRTPRVSRIYLEGLAPDEMPQLVAQFLGVKQVPEELLQFVQERVAGHPYFCEELIRAMRESGAVRIVAARCVVGELTANEHPTTIEGAILSRLDRLSPRQQLCLKLASVIGRHFFARTVQEIYPIEEERREILESLEALRRMDLIRRRASGTELAYSFKHVITTGQTSPSSDPRPKSSPSCMGRCKPIDDASRALRSATRPQCARQGLPLPCHHFRGPVAAGYLSTRRRHAHTGVRHDCEGTPAPPGGRPARERGRDCRAHPRGAGGDRRPCAACPPSGAGGRRRCGQR